jgi:hypothetical protein
MRDATRQLAFLVAATIVASIVTVAALVAPQTHPLAQFAEVAGEPTMEMVTPITNVWHDDLAGGLAIWAQVTAVCWLGAEGLYWLALSQRARPAGS